VGELVELEGVEPTTS